jgi:membrane associated rhomboid family serine protease
MTMLILLLAALGLGYKCTTAEDRERFLQNTLITFKEARRIAARKRQESQPFRDALRARTPRAIVVPALIALNVIIFVFMLRGDGSFGDPNTLIGWGADFGPRTTNGEWWRLATSMFVHAGLFQLLINMAALAQIGLLLERLVGRPAALAAYLAAGTFASLLSVGSYPVAVHNGASGAIFGLYGLLLAVVGWSWLRPAASDGETELNIDSADSTQSIEPSGLAEETITIPLMVVKRLVPAAVMFFLYNMVSGGLPMTSELTALVVGLVVGLVVAKGVSESESPMPRVAATMMVTTIIAGAFAVPLRGIADVRPEMTRVLDVEDRTTQAYKTAADQFKRGRMTADALAQLIDRTIVPEFQTADARLKALTRVPAEHQPMVTDAEEYVRLRSTSWHLRAEGLRRAGAQPLRKASKTETESDASWRLRAESQYRNNLTTLGKAEGAERESLALLERLKSAMKALTLA